MKMLQTHQLARPDREVEDVERMLSAYCKSYDPTRDEVMKILRAWVEMHLHGHSTRLAPDASCLPPAAR